MRDRPTLTGLLDASARVGPQAQALGRQRHASRGALEQLRLELLFQSPNSLTEGWGGQTNKGCSFTKVESRSGRLEAPKGI
jgi:hypothetical protein